MEMTDDEKLAARIACDSYAIAVCKTYGKYGTPAAFIRPDGDGVAVIYPQGSEAEIARLLYKAADEMVSRIPLASKTIQ